jgi:hypothetical protein
MIASRATRRLGLGNFGDSMLDGRNRNLKRSWLVASLTIPLKFEATTSPRVAVGPPAGRP